MGDTPVDASISLADRASDVRLSSDERSQIAARLRMTPAQRLSYLMDMLAFEELARHARRLDRP